MTKLITSLTNEQVAHYSYYIERPIRCISRICSAAFITSTTSRKSSDTESASTLYLIASLRSISMHLHEPYSWRTIE